MTEITPQDLKDMLQRNPDLKLEMKDYASQPFHITVEKPPKRSKYRNERTEWNGIIYDSRKEAAYAANLDALLQANELDWWCRQPQFILPGGVIYKADFIYSQQRDTHVIDVKGIKTKEYRIKKRQVEAIYKIKIEEW